MWIKHGLDIRSITPLKFQHGLSSLKLTVRPWKLPISEGNVIFQSLQFSGVHSLLVSGEGKNVTCHSLRKDTWIFHYVSNFCMVFSGVSTTNSTQKEGPCMLDFPVSRNRRDVVDFLAIYDLELNYKCHLKKTCEEFSFFFFHNFWANFVQLSWTFSGRKDSNKIGQTKI